MKTKVREMMMGVPQYDLKDFLLAVGFLTPRGTTLDQIIVPAKSEFDLPENTGFVQQSAKPTDNRDNVEGVTDTIVYDRKDPEALLDTAAWPKEYLDLERSLPAQADKNQEYRPAISPVGEMNAPNVDKGTRTFAYKTTVTGETEAQQQSKRAIVPGAIESPQVFESIRKKISKKVEHFAYGSRTEVSLREAVGPFPRRTVLVFKRKN